MSPDLIFDLVLIFVLRALDVGIATVRIVLLGRGRRVIAAGLGFVEAIIWVVAVARVLDGLEDPARMVAFAAGFAMGTYLGSLVEEWLAIGQSLVRVIASTDTLPVAPHIRKLGFGATVLNGDGMDGEVRVTFCVVPRKDVAAVSRLIRSINPTAYVTIDPTASIDLAKHEPFTRR